MSFRQEDKIFCNKHQSFEILNHLKKKGLNKIYPGRKILSTYFDNKALQMFRDSEEGVLPRKKIRFREYPDFSEEKFFETKISSIEGRFKITKKIDNNQFNKYISYGYYEKDYGECFPTAVIQYYRNYYVLEKFRFTFDQNIVYKTFNSSNSIQENFNIIEIKSPMNLDNNFFDYTIYGSKNRFSKYSNAINLLFKNQV